MSAKGKPIVKFELDGVLARFSKKQSQDDASIELLKPLVILGAQMAADIRVRVQLHRDLGGQVWGGYSTKARKYRVPPKYAALAGVGSAVHGYRPKTGANKSGAPIPVAIFRSSADFHQQAHPTGFSPTGGMWAGLQARASGDNAVRIEFGGSSPGRGPNVRIDDLSSPRGFVAIPTDVMVQNRFKGGAIFDQLRVNVLQPSEAEGEKLYAEINKKLEQFTMLTLSLA